LLYIKEIYDRKIRVLEHSVVQNIKFKDQRRWGQQCERGDCRHAWEPAPSLGRLSTPTDGRCVLPISGHQSGPRSGIRLAPLETPSLGFSLNFDFLSIAFVFPEPFPRLIGALSVLSSLKRPSSIHGHAVL